MGKQSYKMFCNNPVIRVCKNCNKNYKPTGTSQKYCKNCGSLMVLKASSDWYYTNHEENKIKRKMQSKKFREENPIQRLFYGAKNRAKEFNLDFNIEPEDLFLPEICPVFKTKFKSKTSYAMSLDRIDPSKGYVKGNIQIISKKANTMKSNATKEELKQFADWINAQSG
jgi:hypothetical protein